MGARSIDYNWKKNDTIKGTSIRFIKWVRSANKQKHFLGVCDRCGTIRVFNAYRVYKGLTKSCGCLLDDLVSSGKLVQYSLKARRQKPYLQNKPSNTRDKGIYIFIADAFLELFKDTTIGELIDLVPDY